MPDIPAPMMRKRIAVVFSFDPDSLVSDRVPRSERSRAPSRHPVGRGIPGQVARGGHRSLLPQSEERFTTNLPAQSYANGRATSSGQPLVARRAWTRLAPIVGGLATSVTIRIKGKLNGCVDLTNPGVRIDSGSFRGTLVGTTNDCLALTTTQPAVGSLIYRWNANRDTPILQRSSAQAVSALSGSAFVPTTVNPAFSGNSYLAFTLGTGLVTGAFTGGDAGATSTNVLVTSESNRFIAVNCTPPGIKTLHIGIGSMILR
jgi:hypothetical protein